ncbi:cache domain-containing protein [Arenibaculum sp.]|jgi:signal transduction histidine kinase|uniref:cache domain-containing protein n=1 Tax=Arenibaculum sp. TaxID=2865862 RepID=UPI002E13D22B|nr:cache domain-containing protein [Arenibaculum sp.]
MSKHSVLATLALCGLLATPALAGEFGTADEAKALMLKAADHVAQVGAPAAYQEFSDTKGTFVDRDLYVFCLSMDGDMKAHGGNNALLGKNLKSLKDSDGKTFVAEFLQVASTAGEGWVDYKWPNPTTKRIEPKSSFIKKVGDDVCGVGFYKK